MRNKIENTEQENRRGFPSQAFSLPRCFQPSRISAVSFHTRLITFFYRKLPGLPPDLEEAAEGATEMRNKRKMNETMGRRGSIEEGRDVERGTVSRKKEEAQDCSNGLNRRVSRRVIVEERRWCLKRRTKIGKNSPDVGEARLSLKPPSSYFPLLFFHHPSDSRFASYVYIQGVLRCN